MSASLNRRLGCRLAVGVAASTSSLYLAAVAFGLPSFTTAPKSAPGSGLQAELYALTAGCHATYDRIVIRARSATPGYRVRYVSKVIADGSGNTVSLLGTKRIHVVVPEGRAHTSSGGALLPRVVTPLCPNLRQAKVAGDFEGVVSFGLGLRRKTGFRVFRLTAPTRIVVDVAH
jgi:hypothetical protein